MGQGIPPLAGILHPYGGIQGILPYLGQQGMGHSPGVVGSVGAGVVEAIVVFSLTGASVASAASVALATASVAPSVTVSVTLPSGTTAGNFGRVYIIKVI